MRKDSGTFIISLDFELFWGVRDVRHLQEYSANLLGARKVIPLILELFKRYKIHSTWAIVGFLFCESKSEIMKFMPENIPQYINKKLSPYEYIKSIKEADENYELYHHAPSLIKMIMEYPNQEIGSHTFSHYYCIEEGQNIYTFEQDLFAAIRIAEKFGVSIDSIIYPRNQVFINYVSLCKKYGLKTFRGNEKSWIYRAKNESQQTFIIRVLRVLDAYVNITGHNCYYLPKTSDSRYLLNLPSSRFFRPYNKHLAFFEPLKLKRIKSCMKYAAEKGMVFHLWWHPHNFGAYPQESIDQLDEILQYYVTLFKEFGMASLNMNEVYERLMKGTGYE